MKRKVIQIANSTQLISLPRKWALRHGINKGDELDIKEQGPSLMVSTEKGFSQNMIEIDVSDLTPRLADRFVARAYQKGYDLIKIHYKNRQFFEVIQKKMPELLGFEILEEDGSSCVVKSISSKLEIDFDSSLKKAFSIVVDMSESCVRGYKGKDKNVLSSLFYKDFDVNKFCYFCLRAINKEYYTEPIGMPILYSLIDTLEDIGDDYKDLADNLIKSKQRPEFISLLERLDNLLKICYDFFYRPEKEKSVIAMKELSQIREDIINTMKINLNDHERGALLRIDSIRRMLYLFPTLRLDTLKNKEN